MQCGKWIQHKRQYNSFIIQFCILYYTGDLGTNVTIRIATAGTGVDVPEFTTVSLGDTVMIQ